MNLETLENGAVRCVDDPGEPGYAPVVSRRISITPPEALLLSTLARDHLVGEIGTGLGVSTRALAERARSVTTIDPDPWVHANVWPTLPPNVATLARPPLPPCSLIFIDGLHTEAALRADVATALEASLTADAVLVFHDVEMRVVRETLLALFAKVTLVAPNLGLTVARWRRL